MKRSLLSALLFISLSTISLAQLPKPAQAAAASTVTAASRQASEVPIVDKVLPNGLEVVVLPDSGVPLVTVELAVRNGSFTEPPELNGLSHLYEHMFFKPNKAVLLMQCEDAGSGLGLSQRCSDAMTLKPQIGDVGYLRNLGSMGLTYNGTTHEEVVNYYYTTTSPYLATALRVINDSVRYPLFDETEFANEKKVVVGEIDRNEANPFYFLNKAMMDKLFYMYPTRKNPLGTRETVIGATTEKMRLIKSRYYVPNNSALVVTGDVKPDEVFKLAEQVMGSWERRPIDPFKEFPLVEHPQLPNSEAIIMTKGTGEQTQNSEQNVFIEIGWHGPSIGKDDKATYAADVFSYILGQPDSRFQRDLVDTGLASAVGINYYTQRNVGPITVTLITTPAKAKAALKAVYDEIGQFTSPNYFSDAELDASKSILQAHELFDREETSEYTHTLGFWWSSTGIDYYRGYQKNLNATTRSDINRYIATYISGKPHIGIALLSADAQTAAKLTDADVIGK